MDSKEIAQEGIQALAMLKDPIPNTPISLKPSETIEEREKRISLLLGGIPSVLKHFWIPPKFIRYELTGTIDLSLCDKGICLVGKPGTGKTMSVCLLVRDWLRMKVNESLPNQKRWVDILGVDTGQWEFGTNFKKVWKFISFPEFVMEVQDSFRKNDNENSAYDMLSRVAAIPKLIIDDLGAEKPTEYIRQATYYIINQREMYQLPTFITSNFSLDYLDENIDPRISSRIAGMCEIIRMEGKDKRLEREAKQ